MVRALPLGAVCCAAAAALAVALAPGARGLRMDAASVQMAQVSLGADEGDASSEDLSSDDGGEDLPHPDHARREHWPLDALFAEVQRGTMRSPPEWADGSLAEPVYV